MILAKYLLNLEYDENINEDFEDDWKTVAWWKNKSTILKVRDKDVALSTDREEGVLVGWFLNTDPHKLLRHAEERKPSL